MGTTLGGRTTEKGAGGSNSSRSCLRVPELSVPMSTLMCANTDNSDIDTVMYVRQGVCNSTTAELDCDDDGGSTGLASAVSFRLGQMYPTISS